MPDDILNTIDHALNDWETSDDAMRWTPDTDADLEQAAYETWRQRVPAAVNRGAEPTFTIVDETHVFDLTTIMQAIANGTARRPFDRYSLGRGGPLPQIITISNAGD